MKNPILFYVMLCIGIIAIFGTLRFFVAGDEDRWLCENGMWIRHGNPTDDAPATGCGTQLTTMGKDFEYNWSSLDQGPFLDSVTFATSADLMTWYPSGKTLAEHASVPGAVIRDGKIFVYHVDVSQDGVPEQTGLIRSDDLGKTWTVSENITIEGLEDRAVADPDPVVLDDGSIRLYYFDINESRLHPGELGAEPPQRIYSAISTDGLHFTQEAGVRFTRNSAFDPDVERDGNIWRMYVGTQDGTQVISATSTDGLNFTEEGVAFTGSAVPDVFREGNTWYLFTSGIHIATSVDGKQFTATGTSFRSPQSQVTADPSVIKLSSGKYLMVYKIKK